MILDIQDKLNDTLKYVSKKYNLKHHTELACKILREKWRIINGKIMLIMNANCMQEFNNLFHLLFTVLLYR